MSSTLLLRPILKPDLGKLAEAYELVEDFTIIHAQQTICIPAFFQYDGASIPSPIWPAIGTPFNPRFMRAALFHDWLYYTHLLTREQADSFFYDILLQDGVHSITARLMREAVANFGRWHWENDAEDMAYLEHLKRRIIADNRSLAVYGLTPPI